MTTDAPRKLDGVLSTLDVAIRDLTLAKEKGDSGVAPAKDAFGSVGALLTMMKELMIDEQDYVELGLSCANVCRALDRGLDGRRLDELSRSVLETIQLLTTTVAEIQRKITKQTKRNAVGRIFHARDDVEAIAAWKLDLNNILQVFNTELAIDTHIMVANIQRNVLTNQGGADGKHQSVSVQASFMVGELPPPAPRACFGRDEFIERVINLAQNLTPIALVGAGGIGKTCIALAALHHDYIKQRFGDNRRFIRCDQFSASCTNFLRRLSKVVGAGVKEPEDLAPLRPILSSKEMFIVLDNAESILDPRGADGEEIYGIVEELSQFDNICLCITSRITTIPPDCDTLEIPTLSMEAACDTFYRIHRCDGQSDSINDILNQLDFHPLSVTLLATVAQQNRWDNNRLAGEWEQRQTAVLQTGHNKSLASAVELSLASPMFRELGPEARGLLEVVAFFPQGIDENKLDWLFPNISNGSTIFDTFCVLSLTYRNHGFITMLAPLRDYLCPKNPMLSPPLCAAKERYFSRMAVKFSRNTTVFEESQWITSEDTNVEHLLDVFTSVDANSERVWNACEHFIRHLYWHKPRHTVLKLKIEGLSDEHRSKPQCLFFLAELCCSIGNRVDRKRFLTHTLRLRREGGDAHHIAVTLRKLSGANRMLGLYKEGIQHVKEATEIFGRLGETGEHTRCLNNLAHLLYKDEQIDAAEDVAIRTIKLLPEKGR
ncbi:hypothetical protein BJ322DRAFT_716471 [Thelephora terrestris]|uniref:AAA+ ATPase domain-containing protein n=1 Tax=Thelephora terrestris TaxID=56493 RepID=A0A9P6HIA2_9AGAM|nr:hypothetical protein BJ322DRAFT_716471 [Thelephora terrestris]